MGAVRQLSSVFVFLVWNTYIKSTRCKTTYKYLFNLWVMKGCSRLGLFFLREAITSTQIVTSAWNTNLNTPVRQVKSRGSYCRRCLTGRRLRPKEGWNVHLYSDGTLAHSYHKYKCVIIVTCKNVVQVWRTHNWHGI